MRWAIVRPETVVRWHPAGVRSFWRWRFRRCGGRPSVPLEYRKLIRDMSLANPLWGAPRIHGELLKLGIDVGQTSVAKYMVRRRGGPSKTFLCNHADGIVSMDLFVVPTLSFRLLYGFLILWHHRHRIMWLGVTANPTAEWIARQLTEACGWEAAPEYVVRDRDCVYGEAYIRRLRMMGIHDRPTPSSRREGRIPQRALRPARARLASSSAHPPDAVLPHELGTTLVPMAASSFIMS